MRSYRVALPILVVASLALALPAQGSGGGGGGSGGGGSGGGGYAGCPAAAPSPGPAPGPAPAPAPSPGPSPTPGPGGGTTPGTAGGGTTPGTAGGGTTPGGGGAPGAPNLGGGAAGPAPGQRGGTTPSGGRYGGVPRGGFGKAKFSAEQRYWLNALTFPWEGTFLPKGDNVGYDGVELTIDEAVRGLGGDGAWKLKKRPTIVLVYDPSSKAHIRTAYELEKDKDLTIAVHYFNLIRLDLRTISDQKQRRALGNGLALIIYRASGEREAAVIAPRDGRALVKALRPVLEQDYQRPLEEAVQTMGALLARKRWVEDEIRRHETVVICPDCGKRNVPVAERLKELRQELAEIDRRHHLFATVAESALVSAVR